MPRGDSESVKRAKEILRRPNADPEEVEKLVKNLKKEKAFGYARKIIAEARKDSKLNDNPPLNIKLVQQHALCTYKDPDLPLDERLDEALGLVEKAFDILNEEEKKKKKLPDQEYQETYGIAGAIHKRMWEADGRKEHLDRSLSYYMRGYDLGVKSDYGYTGINAAFILDLLAKFELIEAKKAGVTSEVAKERFESARQIREKIVSDLTNLIDQEGNEWLEKEWWFLVTIAEAFFGLRRYEEALPWLNKAAKLKEVPSWEFESTVRQFASIARMHQEDDESEVGFEESKAWEVLKDFLGGNEAGVRTAFLGKVGLALSGGGFRASLFHIGVLAKLAELDMLRHVQVLSCVSGGSIIGAHYYLEVKKLLEQKMDNKITRQDFIDIVGTIEREFLAGVQKNLRTKLASEFTTNLKMVSSEDYSRTTRLGELYEEDIFSRIDDEAGNQPRWLNELYVRPKGEKEDFAPKHDNWRRATKVPILILNATTLNTGHNWQFTASWMGEPPSSINTEIDGNSRLRRMYYWEAPAPHKEIRLGHAVAASSCVPGVFEPIPLNELYLDYKVLLVDGGVHDNQGVMGLLEENCSVLLVSDASGQMDTQNHPSEGILGVPLRSNAILMARVRDAQFRELEARRRSFLLRGLMFIHLKKDLDVELVDWIGEKPYTVSESDQNGITEYGIPKEIQRRLAAIRTDLDSFSDIEAFSLMTSGYRMTEHEFQKAIQGFPIPNENTVRWRFLSIEKAMKHEKDEATYKKLLSHLEAGESLFFKVWRLSPTLKRWKYVGFLIALLVLLGILLILFRYGDASIITFRVLGVILLVIIALVVIGKFFIRSLSVKSFLTRFGIGIAAAFVGSILAKIHLRFFDRWFLNRGRVEVPHELSDQDPR